PGSPTAAGSSITRQVMARPRPPAYLSAMTQTTVTFGERLRDWRQKRRMSQLDLALEAEISTRHLSFLETGRAAPSREMLLKLSTSLDLPLRERNSLLLSAGYAPVFAQHALDDPA